MKTSTVLLCLLCLFITWNAASQNQFLNITTPMTKGREMYGSAILGDYIYLIGGNRGDEGFTLSVEKAHISPNGNLGAWQETSPLPASRCYIENSTLSLNDIVYVVGGMDGRRDTKSNTILWGRPREDGSIERWQESLPFPGPGVDCTVAVASPGYIHLVGGAVKDDIPVSHVWSARTSPDGSISGWERGPALPFKLWYHCGGVAGGYVWIWGGLTEHKSTSVNGAILYSPILSSGKLGAWQVSTRTLPQAFYSASASVSGQYLISFCPRYSGAEISNDIWYAYAYPTGLSQWVRIPTPIHARLYIGLATDYRRGHVYIPGGRKSKTRGDIDNTVYYFSLRGSKEEVQQETPAAADSLNATTYGSGRENLSYLQQSQSSEEHFKGYLPYDQARQTCLANKKPLILYFHTPTTRHSQQQREILLLFDASKYSDKVVFSEIDASRFPQIAQQHGIFKIPCWVFYNKHGNKITQRIGILKLGELEGYATFIDQQ